jgi:hypothetical protein
MAPSKAQTPVSMQPKRPRDFFQAALEIVEEATAEPTVKSVQEIPARSPELRPKPAAKKKDPAAISRGRLGGLAAGKIRTDKIPAERRPEIAKQGAAARWAKPEDQAT